MKLRTFLNNQDEYIKAEVEVNDYVRAFRIGLNEEKVEVWFNDSGESKPFAAVAVQLSKEQVEQLIDRLQELMS